MLRNLAIALHIGTDAHVFAAGERGPDENLRLAFEATAKLDPDEPAMVRQLIEAVLLKHQAKRWASGAISARTAAQLGAPSEAADLKCQKSGGCDL